MPAVRIGIQLAALRQAFKKALFTASRLGARAVEIDARSEVRSQDLSQTGLRQLRKLLADLNLQVSTVSFPTRRGYAVLEDLDRRVAATQAAMRLARQLGASVVVGTTLRVPEPPDSPQWQTLHEVLTALGAYGHRIGALLATGTGSDSGPDLARFLAALPEGAIGANLDPGSLIVQGHSAVEAVHALGPSILHVHATDGVEDLVQGRGLRVEIGRGSADYPALLAALGQHGYRGWLTIAGASTEDPISEIGNAVQYLTNLLGAH